MKRHVLAVVGAGEIVLAGGRIDQAQRKMALAILAHRHGIGKGHAQAAGDLGIEAVHRLDIAIVGCIAHAGQAHPADRHAALLQHPHQRGHPALNGFLPGRGHVGGGMAVDEQALGVVGADADQRHVDRLAGDAVLGILQQIARAIAREAGPLVAELMNLYIGILAKRLVGRSPQAITERIAEHADMQRPVRRQRFGHARALGKRAAATGRQTGGRGRPGGGEGGWRAIGRRRLGQRRAAIPAGQRLPRFAPGAEREAQHSAHGNADEQDRPTVQHHDPSALAQENRPAFLPPAPYGGQPWASTASR